MQLLASLLVSVLGFGLKISCIKETLQTLRRRKELEGNLSVLQGPVHKIWLKEWLADLSHDERQEQARIIGLQAAQSYTASERSAISAGLEMLSHFEDSVVGRNPMKSRATVERSETKHDNVSGLLLGRTELFIRGAAPSQIAAYILNAADSRHVTRHLKSPLDICICNLETVNDHQVITFYRCKAPGLSDRTFLMSTIAEQLSDDPSTWVVVLTPIPTHRLITAKKDEAGAVRAENRRTWKLTQVSPGVTKLDYVRPLRQS